MCAFAQSTELSGSITDATTGQPLSNISIRIDGSTAGTNSDSTGSFHLVAPGLFNRVSFSSIGYKTITRSIKPGQLNTINIQLQSSRQQLKEVVIRSGKNKRYRNKFNPAVELIQKVIDHKDQNRMQSSDYLQYDQYERLRMSLFNLSNHFMNKGFFSKYKFMIDTTQVINGKKQPSMPVFIIEKQLQNYYRKNPEKSIQILKGQRAVNILKFIDTAGFMLYINRLYGNNIDIYANNIFIVVNQFLSPIADHAPNFYKFFIIDTIQTANGKLVELSFTPRNKGDLLFEGKLLVTLDGRYAVKSCELNLNKQININFLHSFKTQVDFERFPDGRYYLTKTDVKADFGILKDKGVTVFGERTVVFSNYKLNAPLAASFYQGKSLQTILDTAQSDTAYWSKSGGDTLNTQVYDRINKLSNTPSFKRATWIASTLTGGFADLGPVQLGPVGQIFAFNNVEGARFWAGGRTTPQFNKTIYLEGYTAYGTKDAKAKYELNTYLSLNQTPYYRYPNNYIKIGYQDDLGVPGQPFPVDNNNTNTLFSFHRGASDYYIYGKTFTLTYAKDFENHFSYSLGFRNWNQQAAGTLIYQGNDPEKTVINNLTTSEFNLGLRYAPHEQFIQGTIYRHTIYSKYPIFNLEVNRGIKGLFNGSYNYTKIDGSIVKRLYMSQLGYGDITLLGGLLAGKVPFPLLNISPANQTFSYDPDAYNLMNYLEFVTDHYVGINYTQSFSGFFLNKIPLIDRLKLREYLSAKVLYGGVRKENNPALTNGLYNFPVTSNGTFALGNTPYVEAGVGIGNILKVLRIDVIRRFNYLDHPGVSPYGIKFTISPDF